jgi:hypothetical protein
MDFKHQIAAPAALADLEVDALVVVIGDRQDASLAAPLATLIGNAISAGDLVLKKGKSLYLYQPAGVAARRLAVAVAGDSTAKSFKAAVALGLGLLKSSGAKTVAIAAPAIAIGAAHAEAAVVAAADACYVYTHTKPSATPAWTPSSITLFCQKSEAKAVQQGVRQGAAVAAGVTMAREFGNRPGNVCTPTWLGQQAKKIGKQFDLEVDVLDRKEIEKVGMGSFLAVAQGSDEPPRFIVARYEGAPKSQAPVVLVGKGITFDTGGISLKPGAEMDEMKFDMCGAASVLGTLAAGRFAEGQGQPRRPRADLRQHAERQRRQARRRRHQPVGADDRDPQHRRRGPPDPVRRAHLRRAVQAGGGRRRRDAHRRLRDRPRPPSLGPLQRRRRRRGADARRQPVRPRPVLAHAARRGVRRGAEEQLRRHGQRRRPARRRDHGGDVPAPLHGQVPLGAPRHRRHGVEVGRAEGRDRSAGRPAHPLRPRPTRSEAAELARVTEISFYFNVPSRTGYACRLLRRAQRQGMALGGDRARPRHSTPSIASCGRSPPRTSWPTTGSSGLATFRPSLHATTVWLGADPIDAPRHGALLNLGSEAPRGFETFERVFEVVSLDESDRHAARERWKAYARRGYPIKRHEVSA